MKKISELSTKVTNGGMTERGRLSADEYNTILTTVQDHDKAIALLDEATVKNCGYFLTLEALQHAYPKAGAGSKAYVGASYPYAIYLWNAASSAWIDSGSTGGEEDVKLGNYYTKAETDEKVAELESNTTIFDIINKTNGSLAVNGTPFIDFDAGQILKSDGSVIERSDLPTIYVSNFFKPTNPRDFGLVRLNNLHPIWDGNSASKSCNVALYDENKKFVRSFIYNSTAIVAVPFGYYLRTSHLVSDNNISNLVILDPELVAVEDVVFPIAEQVKPLEQILPFFEKFIEIPAEKYVNGGFIGGGGYIVNQEGYSYIIFNVEGHKKIKIHIGKNTMWGAPIWTTYSGLNDGEIDQSLKIRNYVGTEDDSQVAYDAIIELSNNEKYIVIGNSTEELEEYGYSLEYYDGYYKGNSAQKVDEKLNEVDERLNSISSIIQNKNVVVLGDSITWQGGVDCTETKGWTYWFKARTKPKTIKSFAWSGATWTNSDTTKVNEEPPLALDLDNTIWQQVRRLIAAYNANTQVKPDMVIIAAGINDVIALNRGERIGCLDKTAAQAFADRTKYITDANANTILTMADAIRYSCELLLETFPNVQIILTTPLQSSYVEVEQSRWESACKIIKDSARYMVIPCIEQGEVCGVYYTQEYTNHTNLSDGLHPNETGANKIGNVIASIVNSFVA